MLRGKMKREQEDREVQYLMHHELVLAILGPHMKKADRDRAYREFSRKGEKGKAPALKKSKKKKIDPLEFWEKIDEKAGKN